MCFAGPLVKTWRKQRNEFFLSGEFIDGPVKDRKTLSQICIISNLPDGSGSSLGQSGQCSGPFLGTEALRLSKMA